MKLEVFPVDVDLARYRFADMFDDPRDHGTRAHQGIDLFAPAGTLVRSPVAGRALPSPSLTEEHGKTGYGVSVRTPASAGGYTMHFAHFQGPALVRAGERVQVGTPLGRVGTTGNARGHRPHLHFHIEDANGVRVNPYPLLLETKERAQAMPGTQDAADATWVTMTGRDRYPSGNIVRLGDHATTADVHRAVRLLRRVVDAYRVPSRLLSNADDYARMGSIAQTYRQAVHAWTQTAFSYDPARAARIVNAVSENLEGWFTMNREIVASGPAPSFWTAFEASVRRTGEIIANVGQAVVETGKSIGMGLGFALVIGLMVVSSRR